MSRTGACLCGAVTYEIETNLSHSGACHCGMCRKWSGGVYLAVEVAADQMSIEGSEHVTIFTSSEWGERGFCNKCGSSLYYRVTAPGPYFGQYHVAMGTLDRADGIALSSEIFTDKKPAGYSFAENTQKMTGAEVMAMFASEE